jgi:hypothetical protein
MPSIAQLLPLLGKDYERGGDPQSFSEYDAYLIRNTASLSAIPLRLSRGSLASTLPWHRFFRISSNIRLFSTVIRFCTILMSSGSFNDCALAIREIFP